MPRLRLTSEVLQTVEDAASKGLTDRQIGKLLGVSRATISRHKIDNEAFETSLKKGRARGIEQVANAFFEQALQVNTTAAIFFLKCRGGWSEKVDPEELISTSLFNVFLPDGSSVPLSEIDELELQ